MCRLVLVNMGGVLAGEIVGKVLMQTLTQVARREILCVFEGLLFAKMLTRTNRFRLIYLKFKSPPIQEISF